MWQVLDNYQWVCTQKPLCPNKKSYGFDHIQHFRSQISKFEMVDFFHTAVEGWTNYPSPVSWNPGPGPPWAHWVIPFSGTHLHLWPTIFTIPWALISFLNAIGNHTSTSVLCTILLFDPSTRLLVCSRDTFTYCYIVAMEFFNPYLWHFDAPLSHAAPGAWSHLSQVPTTATKLLPPFSWFLTTGDIHRLSCWC